MNAAAGTVVAVLLSLVSAAGYALAAVAQSRLAAASPVQDGRGALRALLAHGQWWSAVGLNAAGALAHVAALHYGPLTLVQPLGALTLVAALPLGAYHARRRVTRTEWRGALWTLGGLLGLVAVTGPAAPGEALSLSEALVVAAATALLIAALASGRGHGRQGGAGARGRRGLGHATASGIASGVASALTQTLTAALARELPGGAAAWWQTTLLALLVSGFATGGLLLSQAAYRGGLAAPLAVVNLSNPAAAAVIGVALLGETFRAGAWGWLVAAAASLVAARGVVLLTKDGATTPEPDATRAREAEDGPTPEPAFTRAREGWETRTIPSPRVTGTAGGEGAAATAAGARTELVAVDAIAPLAEFAVTGTAATDSPRAEPNRGLTEPIRALVEPDRGPAEPEPVRGLAAPEAEPLPAPEAQPLPAPVAG
ncbi:DMT family transporter [Streptomyces sp. NPDC093795]|uniref:DMT family transporter n=1 Tax=Streptomyces sp. NPDC093795 TaxID=3366051 RepID=UPI00380CE72F